MLGRVTDQAESAGVEPGRRAVRLTVIGWRSVIVWAIAAIVVTAVATAALWLAAASADTARAATQLEAIRTGLSIGVGAGGLFALWLATRRQRSTEVGLTQQERTLEATIADADEKRITELYTKAAEQIGHDKAPVRLAGIYALERLAQDNPRHRQTIVNVLCAYLRMPFPYEEPDTAQDVTLLEEHEIRVTIQRLLCAHLRPRVFSPTKSDADHARQPANPRFWPGLDLNLNGARLFSFDLRACEVGAADFSHAVFVGRTTFRGATFSGEAGFRNAVFRRLVNFDQVRFGEFSWFHGTRFEGGAMFGGAVFAETAGFKTAEFLGDARFRHAAFQSAVLFQQAVFHAKATFGSAEFHDNAGFARTTFGDTLELRGATFHAGVWFRDARFDKDVVADRARFHHASFQRARFAGGGRFAHTVFHYDAEFAEATFARKAWFNTACFEQTANFASAVFTGAAHFAGAQFMDRADFDRAEFTRTGMFQGARFRERASMPAGDVDLTGAIVGPPVERASPGGR